MPCTISGLCGQHIALLTPLAGRDYIKESVVRVLTLISALGLWVPLVLLGGCSTQQVYENAYHGLHARERLLHPAPPGETPPRTLSYRDYEKARKAVIGGQGQ